MLQENQLSRICTKFKLGEMDISIQKTVLSDHKLKLNDAAQAHFWPKSSTSLWIGVEFADDQVKFQYGSIDKIWLQLSILPT